MTTKLVRYHEEDGNRLALVKKSRKYLHALIMDSPLRVQKLEPVEARHMTVLEEIPTPKHLKIFRRFGRAHGMTDAAKSFLKEAAHTTETDHEPQP